MDNDTKLILDRIEDLKSYTVERTNDLKKFYNGKINQFKEFYTASRLDMKEDIGEIKQSNKEVSETLDNYVTNHQRHHNKILKWQTKIIIIVAVIGFLASIGNPFVLPIIMKFIFGITL